MLYINRLFNSLLERLGLVHFTVTCWLDTPRERVMGDGGASGSGDGARSGSGDG